MKPILATILAFAAAIVLAESYLAYRQARLDSRSPLEQAIETEAARCESLWIHYNDPEWEVTCAGCDEIGRFRDHWPSWYTAHIYRDFFKSYRRHTGLDRFPFSDVAPECWGDTRETR